MNQNDEIKKLRISNGLTQKEMARWIGIAREVYTNKEKGIIPFTLEEYETIKKKFEKHSILRDISIDPIDNSKGEIIETIFRKDRFYVRVNFGNGSIKTFPKANFVWLQSNPSFKEIPKGYVIHHLDLDKTNDDVSNLALMYKHHHHAYHLKFQNINAKVSIDNGKRDIYFPTKKPRYFYNERSKRYFICFYERHEDGQSPERVDLWRRNNKPMFTEEDAKTYCEEIWEQAERYRNALDE